MLVENNVCYINTTMHDCGVKQLCLTWWFWSWNLHHLSGLRQILLKLSSYEASQIYSTSAGSYLCATGIIVRPIISTEQIYGGTSQSLVQCYNVKCYVFHLVSSCLIIMLLCVSSSLINTIVSCITMLLSYHAMHCTYFNCTRTR